LYNPEYLSNEEPNALENPQEWLDHVVTSHIEHHFEYFQSVEELQDNSRIAYNFLWLSPYELKLAEKKFAEMNFE
jgi:hypothetical protein